MARVSDNTWNVFLDNCGKASFHQLSQLDESHTATSSLSSNITVKDVLECMESKAEQWTNVYAYYTKLRDMLYQLLGEPLISSKRIEYGQDIADNGDLCDVLGDYFLDLMDEKYSPSSSSSSSNKGVSYLLCRIIALYICFFHPNGGKNKLEQEDPPSNESGQRRNLEKLTHLEADAEAIAAKDACITYGVFHFFLTDPHFPLCIESLADVVCCRSVQKHGIIGLWYELCVSRQWETLRRWCLRATHAGFNTDKCMICPWPPSNAYVEEPLWSDYLENEGAYHPLGSGGINKKESRCLFSRDSTQYLSFNFSEGPAVSLKQAMAWACRPGNEDDAKAFIQFFCGSSSEDTSMNSSPAFKTVFDAYPSESGLNVAQVAVFRQNMCLLKELIHYDKRVIASCGSKGGRRANVRFTNAICLIPYTNWTDDQIIQLDYVTEYLKSVTGDDDKGRTVLDHTFDVALQRFLHGSSESSISRIKLLSYLLEWYGGSLIERSSSHLTHQAVKLNSLRILKSLYRSGANMDNMNPIGMTPFLIACNEDHLHIAKWLYNECGANPLITRNPGETCLHMAHSKSLMEWLLGLPEALSMCNARECYEGRTPLFFSLVQAESLDVALPLLRCSNVRVDAIDNHGNSVFNIVSDLTNDEHDVYDNKQEKRLCAFEMLVRELPLSVMRSCILYQSSPSLLSLFREEQKDAQNSERDRRRWGHVLYACLNAIHGKPHSYLKDCIEESPKPAFCCSICSCVMEYPVRVRIDPPVRMLVCDHVAFLDYTRNVDHFDWGDFACVPEPSIKREIDTWCDSLVENQNPQTTAEAKTEGVKTRQSLKRQRCTRC